MKKTVCLLLTAVLLCLPTADVKARSGKKADAVIAIPAAAEPGEGFDPTRGWGVGEHTHEPLIQSTLLRTGKELGIENDLATRYSCSEDGLTWRVKIRDGVFFSDGQPLTAQDVAFTYNTCRDHGVTSDFSMMKEAAAIDETTVEFYMERPFSVWPYTMAVVGIVPEHCYDETYGQNPVGSGRYIMTQWDRGSKVVLEANPDYYDEQPQIKKLTILFLDDEAALEAARRGETDVAHTSALYSDASVDGYHLLRADTLDHIGFNLPSIPPQETDGVSVGNAFTQDVEVRRAINLALDREKIAADVLHGCGTAAYSVCDRLPWYNESARISCSMETAKKLMEKAGWQAGEDGIREKDGIRAGFSLLVVNGEPLRKLLADEIARQLLELGIEVNVEETDEADALERAKSEALIWALGSPTPMELYNLYHTDPETGYARYSPYANQTVDAYMDAALEAFIPQASYELWQYAQWDGAEGITQDGDIPWIWLCNMEHLYFIRDGLEVEDQKVHPHGHGWSILDNVEDWKWEF